MIPLFLALSAVNLAVLVSSAVLGFAAGGETAAARWHILVGAVAALVCCAAHCVVFTYFVATAKWVQHAVGVRGLDPALARPTRSFKAQAFPWAMSAMATAFATAVLGVLLDAGYRVGPAWHAAAALGAIAVNASAAGFEYGAVARNGRLIDQILLHIAHDPAATRADAENLTDAR